MSDRIAPVRPRIVIDKTEPPESDHGKSLHQCFFMATDVDGVYNLYSPNSKIVAANLVTGQNFNFTVDNIHFDITEFTIDKSNSSGNWESNKAADPDEEGGSYQAQAGVGADDDGEENASAAYA
jgi:hypothetical protein